MLLNVSRSLLQFISLANLRNLSCFTFLSISTCACQISPTFVSLIVFTPFITFPLPSFLVLFSFCFTLLFLSFLLYLFLCFIIMFSFYFLSRYKLIVKIKCIIHSCAVFLMFLFVSLVLFFFLFPSLSLIYCVRAKFLQLLFLSSLLHLLQRFPLVFRCTFLVFFHLIFSFLLYLFLCSIIIFYFCFLSRCKIILFSFCFTPFFDFFCIYSYVLSSC